MADFFEDAVDALAMTEVAQALMDHAVMSADTLAATDSSSNTMDLATTASDVFTVTELESNNIDFCTTVVDDLLDEEEVYDPDTNTFSIVQTGLREEAASAGNEALSVNDPLSIFENANGWVIPAVGIDAAAEDTIGCTDEVRFTVEDKSVDGIVLFEDVQSQICRNVADICDLSDTVVSVQEYGNVPVIDNIGLSESLSFIHCEANPDCRPEFRYTPYIGSTTDPNAPAPPDPEYTAPGATAGFRLQFPATGPVTDELLLKNPNFGNIDRFTPQRVTNETRNGDLKVFADPNWPKVESQLFSFSVLTKAKAREVLDWHTNHLGQEIRLIDHEDRLWVGIIVQVNDPIVHDGRKSWTTSFEFQGTKV